LRATRAGRTALRAVERDDDPETQAPEEQVVLVFRIVFTLIPPAAGRRPTSPQRDSPASCSSGSSCPLCFGRRPV